jgi:hypothetical protein
MHHVCTFINNIQNTFDQKMLWITFLSAQISSQNYGGYRFKNLSKRSMLPANTKSFSHVTRCCCDFLIK